MADVGFERGVPLSITFSTVLMRTHEAGDTCAQNDKKGDSLELKEPPGSATVFMPLSLEQSGGLKIKFSGINQYFS